MGEDVPITLNHCHGGGDVPGAIGTDDRVDLVLGDQSLVRGCSQVGRRLVIEQDPLHGAAEDPPGGIDPLDEDVSGRLVDRSRGGEHPGQGQGAPDPDRLPAGHRGLGPGGGPGAGFGGGGRGGGPGVTDVVVPPPSSSPQAAATRARIVIRVR